MNENSNSSNISYPRPEINLDQQAMIKDVLAKFSDWNLYMDNERILPFMRPMVAEAIAGMIRGAVNSIALILDMGLAVRHPVFTNPDINPPKEAQHETTR